MFPDIFARPSHRGRHSSGGSRLAPFPAAWANESPGFTLLGPPPRPPGPTARAPRVPASSFRGRRAIGALSALRRQAAEKAALPTSPSWLRPGGFGTGRLPGCGSAAWGQIRSLAAGPPPGSRASQAGSPGDASRSLSPLPAPRKSRFKIPGTFLSFLGTAEVQRWLLSLR